MIARIFTQPECQPCNATARTFERHGIAYVLIDVSTDQAAYNYIRDLGYQQTPVVVFGDQHWSGYRPERIRALL